MTTQTMPEITTNAVSNVSEPSQPLYHSCLSASAKHTHKQRRRSDDGQRCSRSHEQPRPDTSSQSDQLDMSTLEPSLRVAVMGTERIRISLRVLVFLFALLIGRVHPIGIVSSADHIFDGVLFGASASKHTWLVLSSRFEWRMVAEASRGNVGRRRCGLCRHLLTIGLGVISQYIVYDHQVW